MLTLPVVRQSRKYDCGAACAKSVLGYWECRYPRLSAAGWPNQIDGTDPRVLEALFRKTGLGVVAGEMTVSVVRHLTGLGWPVVALVRQNGVGHYVVVRGVSRGKVFLMDPDGGEQTERVAAFVERWRAGDVCRTGFSYQQWGIAAGVEL